MRKEIKILWVLTAILTICTIGLMFEIKGFLYLLVIAGVAMMILGLIMFAKEMAQDRK